MLKLMITLAFMSFMTVLGSSAALASCQEHATKACPVYTPQGDLVTKGTVKEDLNYWVEICYPANDWQSQKERTGQNPYYVSLNVTGETGVARGINRFVSYEDMKDAKLITTQCYRQYYKPDWVVMTVTQCREEGYYMFLTTGVLTAADHKKRVFFDGRPDLDRYAYRVR